MSVNGTITTITFACLSIFFGGLILFFGSLVSISLKSGEAVRYQPVEILADEMSLAQCQHYVGHAQRGGARVACVRTMQ